MLESVDFESIDVLLADLKKAKNKVQKFQQNCELNGIVFLCEKNLVFAFIISEYCRFYHHGSMYGINRWACSHFNIGKETFRKLYYLDGIVDFNIIMKIIEYGNLSRGIASYFLLVYSHSPYSSSTAKKLLSLAEEQDFERRVA